MTTHSTTGAPAGFPAAALINGERVLVLSWPRAILMQMAHPLVAAGVAQHSRFDGGPLAPVERLHGTIRAMLTLTFGTPPERAAVAARINRIHDSVHGTLREAVGRWPAGTSYSAHDPELLAWVHVTLLESMLMGYERFVDALPPETADAYCREAADGARMLGVPEALLPLSADAVRAQVAATLGGDAIAVGGDARRIASAVLAPPWSGLMFPATRLNRLLTAALLPAPLREAYGLRWTERDRRAFGRASRVFRAWSRVAPAAARRWHIARGR